VINNNLRYAINHRLQQTQSHVIECCAVINLIFLLCLIAHNLFPLYYYFFSVIQLVDGPVSSHSLFKTSSKNMRKIRK
jgi:hypothetical protein